MIKQSKLLTHILLRFTIIGMTIQSNNIDTVYLVERGDSKFVCVLKTLMWCKQINQEQLAKILDCRKSQLNNILKGKLKPSYFVLQQLKNNFDWDMSHYFE